MNKIRKGDNIVVLTGKDRGRKGSVARVLGERVVVEGVNRVKKHVRPNPMTNEVGGIVEREMPIHLSNVAVVNPATQKADRVGIRVLENGRRERYFKSNGARVDV